MPGNDADQSSSATKRDLITIFLAGVILTLCAMGALAAPETGTVEKPQDPGVEEFPLSLGDTSSPRATLGAFLSNVEAGWRKILQQGNLRWSDTMEARRAIRTLDLSKTAPAQQDDVAVESMLMLFDVFNRIQLPPLEEVPGKDEVKGKEGEEAMKRWIIPNTPISIALVAEGPRAGEWLFVPEVIRETAQYYERTRHLPLKPGAIVEDGYQLTIATIGWIIPAGLVAALPTWVNKIYYGQTVLQWLLLFLAILVAIFLAWAGFHWKRSGMTGRQSAPLRTLLPPVLAMLLAYGTAHIIDEGIHITGPVLSILTFLLMSVVFLGAAWAVLLTGRLLSDAIIASPHTNLTTSTAQLIRGVIGIGSFLTILIITAVWLNYLGVPILGVVTGLGIGGIAIALAGQRTVENFFGAIMLIADHPVRIGDFCQFGDRAGTLEKIGMRSTRIRTPERSILTIPNAEFSRYEIENLAQRDQLLLTATLNLSLETSSEQLQTVLYRVRGLLLDRDVVDNDPARVKLIAIGPHSFDIEIFAYIKTADWEKFLDVREDIFLDIMREIEEAGTAIAPPAQTTYLRSAEKVASHPDDKIFQQ